MSLGPAREEERVTIRVVYRSHGGENSKNRPTYYSKLLGLVSFLRAVEDVDAELVFLNDGPIPADRFGLMQQYGTTVELPGVGMRGSYRAALDYATSGRWPASDLVWFSEDDYLYLPQAFRKLERAISTITEAEYFALYASTPRRPVKTDDEPFAHRPTGWRDLAAWEVDGQEWVRIYSTTSTFGARIGALTEDMGVFRFCMVPHRRMLRDHDTCLLLQGFEPYSYADLTREAVGLAGGTPAERLHEAALAPFRIATNLRAHRRPSRRRMFVSADPNLATHMEHELLALGGDWAAVAAETTEWGRARGWLPAAGGAEQDPTARTAGR
jgi:hypothetical protein